MDFKNLSSANQKMVKGIEADIIGLMTMNNLSHKPNLRAIFMTIYAYYFLVEFYISDANIKNSKLKKSNIAMVFLEVYANTDYRLKIGNLIVDLVDQCYEVDNPDIIAQKLFGVFSKTVSRNSFETVSYCQQKAMAQTERFVRSIGEYDYGNNPDVYLDKITVTLALDMQQKSIYEVWKQIE